MLKTVHATKCTCRKLYMLQTVHAKNCTMYILQTVHAANCTMYMLQTVHAANCTCCKLYMLQTVHAANCTCCKLYMLQTVLNMIKNEKSKHAQTHWHQCFYGKKTYLGQDSIEAKEVALRRHN